MMLSHVTTLEGKVAMFDAQGRHKVLEESEIEIPKAASCALRDNQTHGGTNPMPVRRPLYHNINFIWMVDA